MPLCERLGWSIEDCDPSLHIRVVDGSLNSEDRADNASDRRSVPVTCGTLVGLDYYYLDDRQNARVWAEKVLDFAEEYFFGEWRDPFPSGDF